MRQPWDKVSTAIATVAIEDTHDDRESELKGIMIQSIAYNHAENKKHWAYDDHRANY